eukprot:GSChrysophyteH1.ASY1.ANO1.657.1 assembled CDS
MSPHPGFGSEYPDEYPSEKPKYRQAQPPSSNKSARQVQQQSYEDDYEPYHTNSNSNSNSNSNRNTPDEPLIECRECGRRMRAAALEKHSKICAKVFQQKRKAFDSKKMRIEAIAAEAPEVIKLAKQAERDQRTGRNNRNPLRGGGNKKKWEEQSRQFREAMRNSRQVTKAINSGGPLPEYTPAAVDPSFVQCPTCGRSFNQKAADRHIPLCSNIKAKPKALKAGSGSAAVSAAGSYKTRKRGVQF